MKIETVHTFKNGEIGRLEYDQNKIAIKLIEMVKSGDDISYKIPPSKNINPPVLAEGFIAYFTYFQPNIKFPQLLFDHYIDERRKRFLSVEGIKPDSILRDLEAEFMTQLIAEEKDRATVIPKLYDYVSDEYVNELKEFVRSFLVYIETKMADSLEASIKNDPLAGLVLNTILTESERQKLCSEIIENNGIVNNLDRFTTGKEILIPVFKNLTKEHHGTLAYLLGGKKPNKIKKLSIASHQSAYQFLLKYSAHKHKGKPTLPKIFREKFCPEVLCNHKGESIAKLNNLV